MIASLQAAEFETRELRAARYDSPTRPDGPTCGGAMFRRLLVVSLVVAIGTGLLAHSQSSPIKIAGVQEPPELSGEPKKVKKLTDAQRQFAEMIGELTDEAKAKAARPKLNKFIEEHPDYSDAYFMRAMCDFCMLNSREYGSILKDIDTAISTHSAPTAPIYGNLSDHHSLRGKVRLILGQHREAMDDLETAMKVDLDSADRIFNIGGVEPEKTSNLCTWNLTELDTLVAKFPEDYRVLLFRGLYFKFFTTFKEDYYAKAMQEFQKAALLNPKSPLPHYFIAELYRKASFWTKAAWSSDESRNEATRKAIPAYTKAIQLNPKFMKAYEGRASTYYVLKQYPQAIGDHDKVLELDPENASAYADRGLTKLEAGQYLSATLDLGNGIRRKRESNFAFDEDTLGISYEHRADAYMKMGDYQHAIADYSKAIERRLANDTFLLSLQQIRGLYPEYNSVSDEQLCRKINALFWPEFEYNVIAKQLLEENGNWEISFLLEELYEKRGDAYLRANDFRRGVLDFNRIFKGIPNFADVLDRWRLLGCSSDGEEYFLDVKSVELSDSGPARVWLKNVNKNKSYTVQSIDLDCKARRLSLTSTVVYNSEDQLVSSSETGSGWQRIIPGTQGEQLYLGMCSGQR
jgi:tetratricopeptide (TPR) repeat protein